MRFHLIESKAKIIEIFAQQEVLLLTDSAKR